MIVFQGKYRNHVSTYNWKTPEWFNDAVQTLLNIFINSWYTKLSRLTFIKVHYHDTWSVDSTLAPIILKLLKKMEKHGAPNVDDEDVPDELKATSAPPKENDWDTDDNWFKRWDYIQAEMIWAFEQLNNDEWEDQFYSGKSDTVFEEDENGYTVMKSGPNDTFKFDKEGYMVYSSRIDNGCRLFGKYYRNLWA